MIVSQLHTPLLSRPTKIEMDSNIQGTVNQGGMAAVKRETISSSTADPLGSSSRHSTSSLGKTSYDPNQFSNDSTPSPPATTPTPISESSKFNSMHSNSRNLFG